MMKIRHLAWMALVASLALTTCGQAEDVSLFFWEMPYAEAFPAGLALDDSGLVYVAADGGREVYRLDPTHGVFRGWGVGEGPEDVLVIDGVVFTTVGDSDRVVYFDPGGLGVTTSVLPFTDVHPGEIHRGRDTDSGHFVFWIVERDVPGILRLEYDPVFDAPEAIYDPSDGTAGKRGVPMTPRQVTATYESFTYDISLIPAPAPIAPSRSTYPYSEWLLPIGDDAYVQDLALAEDGALWISFGAPFLFRLDPEAGTLQMMETIQNVAILQGLLPAADGSIWFGNDVDGSIGHFDRLLGVSEVWRIPGVEEIYDLTFALDGAIWYTDRLADHIGRFDPWTGEVILYPLPEDSEPLYLAIDDEGTVWFSCGWGNAIGQLVGAAASAPSMP